MEWKKQRMGSENKDFAWIGRPKVNPSGKNPARGISQPSLFLGAAWVGFSTESLGMRERYLPGTEFPGSPKGRQIWKTGTAPAQMAASSWLWQGEVLTLCCWLPGPSQPQQSRPGHRKESM